MRKAPKKNNAEKAHFFRLYQALNPTFYINMLMFYDVSYRDLISHGNFYYSHVIDEKVEEESNLPKVTPLKRASTGIQVL